MKSKASVLDSVHRPTLLVNESVARRNIEKMAGLARRSGIVFRPHFKTHQSADIANWYRDYGVSAITVSSMTMARYFAGHGWKDITVAFPVNLRETAEINDLAGKTELNILVEHPEVTKALAGRLKHETGVFIEVDTGYRRTGIQWNDTEKTDEILEVIRKTDILRFRGFLSHTGHTYTASSTKEILGLLHTATERLNTLKKRYLDAFPGLILSLGDTPSFSLTDTVSGIDEMRPGNFVFYDLMQQSLGVCSWEEIAVAVACPVVALYPSREEMVLYGGAVHFSKEHLLRDGRKIYGMTARYTTDGWVPGTHPALLTGLSQEHGILHMNRRHIASYRHGDLVFVLPVHSCLTANLMRGYLTTGGKILEHMNGERRI